MTTDEAGLLIATLAAAYPRQQLAPLTVEIYTRNLADLDHDLATAAVSRIIATSKFFPTIAEIREAAAETATNLPTAAEAWEMAVNFTRLVQSDGALATQELPLEVHQAIRAVGGTWEIRTSENTVALRAQFRDTYEDIRRRAIEQVTLANVAELERPQRPELEPAA